MHPPQFTFSFTQPMQLFECDFDISEQLRGQEFFSTKIEKEYWVNEV